MSEPDPSARQHVTAEGGFAYGVVGADLHVYVDGPPSYVLEEWVPPPESDPEWLRELPSRLLSARHEIVPFTGRADELAELRTWRGAVGRRLAVRWLHGPGGQGKSRLAAAFARDSVAEGWKVVRAVHAPGNVLPGGAGGDLRAVGAAGVLLVVDYADHWPLPHLTWLLSNRLLYRPDLPTRVLLLARSTDQWPAVQAALHDSQAATSLQTLEPLRERGSERAEMFEAARDEFAACLGATPGAPGTTPVRVPSPVPLDGPDFGLTLAVHMAALVSVDAHLHGRRPPTDAAGLVTYLLNREQAHWARLHTQDAGRATAAAGRTYTTPPQVMNRAVFTAALTGTMHRGIGRIVVDRVTGTPPAAPHPAERVLADHSVCYPPSGSAPGVVLEPLLPDRLAEDFLALTLPGHCAQSVYPPSSWAPEVLGRLLTHGGERRPESWTPRALIFLAASAERWRHMRHAHLYPLLRRAPWLAVAAGGRALGAVSALDDIDMELLEAIEARLPRHEHPDLDPGRAVLVERLARHWLAHTDVPDQHAVVHNKLADALDGAGRYEEAYHSRVRVVELLERLEAERPGSQTPHLAGAYGDLFISHTRLGRPHEALEAAARAAHFARLLAEADPEARFAGLGPAGRFVGLEPDGRFAGLGPAGRQARWAIALCVYGQALVTAGRQADGYRAHAAALDVLVLLGEQDAEQHGNDLGQSLLNIGADLSDAGRGGAAVAATEGAVHLLGPRRAGDPPDHPGTYALALSNLAIFLLTWHHALPVGTDWRKRALDASTRAVKINRHRAEANPDALTPSLEQSLRAHADALKAKGRAAEARVIRTEADELRNRMRPPPDVSGVPRAHYHPRQALETIEAIDALETAVYRYMARIKAPVYTRRLVALLLPVAAREGATGLAARTEITDAYRRLAEGGLTRDRLDHAEALVELALHRWGMSHHTEVEERLRRAVGVYEDLMAAAGDPGSYRDDVVRTLGLLARFHEETGAKEEARAVRQQIRWHHLPWRWFIRPARR
ncbi:hypothetical protein ACFCV9_03520 [Streptomyces sp. NPDC056367]|uniref:hypothetical protein n=1 Tax=Streptomyces sp. NPDC056367 TaxID=3345797 RepID=UPI0035E08D6A